jgi:hypothetical protein
MCLSRTLDQADEEVFLSDVPAPNPEGEEEIEAEDDGSSDEEGSYEEEDKEEDEEEKGEALADEAGRLGSPNPLRQWSDDADNDVLSASPASLPDWDERSDEVQR